LLRGYPKPEVRAVRKAFADAKAAYLDRGESDRPAKFAAAMNRFATSLQTLAEKIEPLREQLPLRHRDQELIAATAYPRPDSTDAEVFYNRLDPFFWSWVVSLAATICLLSAVGSWQRPLFWFGAAMLLVGQTFAVVGMGFRAYVTHLIPLTGMFETVEFVAIYAGLLGLWYALVPLWLPGLWRAGVDRVDLVGLRGKRKANCRSQVTVPTAEIFAARPSRAIDASPHWQYEMTLDPTLRILHARK